MIYPLIGCRLHGWLDDIVSLTYVLGALLFGLSGMSLWIALGSAGAHFILTRLTNYPQGLFRILPFTTHAWIELTEGIVVISLTWLVAKPVDLSSLYFLTFMGASQFVAFSFSDYQEAAPKPLAVE